MKLVVGTASGVFADGSSGSLDGRVIRQVVRSSGALFAAASDGVYRSTNDGQMWTRAGIDVGEVWNVAVSPHNPRTLYAGTQPAHVFVSHDSGNYVGTETGEVWRVSASGEWARVRDGLPSVQALLVYA
jgi:hypothetical protein